MPARADSCTICRIHCDLIFIFSLIVFKLQNLLTFPCLSILSLVPIHVPLKRGKISGKWLTSPLCNLFELFVVVTV